MSTASVWFRQDLRLADNLALFEACTNHNTVIPVYILDEYIVLGNEQASWQWVAGCRADAAPYFRIFNPIFQNQKFDLNSAYVHRWVPEPYCLNNRAIHAPWESANAPSMYSTVNYPKPIINHRESRTKTLAYYSQLKKRTHP